MRTNIEIDDDLMTRALRVSGLKTKRAAVEEGLRVLIKLREQEPLRELFGRIRWEGDLGQSRLARRSE
jgi:Arc/MetJ family transcription regulator